MKHITENEVFTVEAAIDYILDNSPIERSYHILSKLRHLADSLRILCDKSLSEYEEDDVRWFADYVYNYMMDSKYARPNSYEYDNAHNSAMIELCKEFKEIGDIAFCNKYIKQD